MPRKKREQMNILLSNDDGVHSPGLARLADAIQPLCERMAVVAPDRNLSGASSALTLTRPLYPQQQLSGFISVDGTPVDCVHLAITGMLDFVPDRVVSGINIGANLGDDVWYSGTVAAAVEGRYLGCAAIAVSLAGTTHFATAGKVVAELITADNHLPNPPNTILNVNVPDLPYNEIKGYRITRLGFRHAAQPCIDTTTPRGARCYWIAEAGEPQDNQPDTDFAALDQGYVSITPLHIDLTNHQQLMGMRKWMDGVNQKQKP